MFNSSLQRPLGRRQCLRILMVASLSWLAMTPAAPLAQAQDKGPSAQEIVDKMLDNNNSLGFQAGRAQLSLLIEDKTGERRVRSLDVKSKNFDGATRTVVKLTEPKEVKGQAFLFAANKAAEDDVWMFLPAFKVTRRIEGSNKKGAFLGSHFTFADLESRDVKDSAHKRLEDEKIAKDEVFVIESTPKDASKSDYGKVVSFIRKDDYVPLKVRFYDKDGKSELKTIFVERLDKDSKGKSYVKQMTLRAKSGGYTTLKIDALDENAQLPDAIFSKDEFGK